MKKLVYLCFLGLGAIGYGECLDFYYVKRPVAYGTVFHEYIGVWNPGTEVSEALGLLKGDEDRKVFDEFIASPWSKEGLVKLSFLGSACDENAKKALLFARKYAKDWDSFYESTLLFYFRMGVTPLVGKPCRNVAMEIAERLKEFLH